MAADMNIILVKPGFGSLIEGYNLNDGRMEPLALGVLAGLTPPEHTVRLMDDRTEDIDFQAPADLVAISVDTFNSRRAYRDCATGSGTRAFPFAWAESIFPCFRTKPRITPTSC